MKTNSVTILHLSDLHLGESIDDVGTISNKVMRTAKSLWSGGAIKMQAHDSFILNTLHTDVKSAAREFGRDSFNLLVVTGDISTNANSEKRFHFAKEYLTNSTNHKGNSIGLNFSSDSVFCVPGNHDKLYQSSCANYLQHFGKLPSNSLPYKVNKEINGIHFTFYGIDSNLYEEENVAKGAISEPTLAWLKEQKNNIAANENAPKPIRILLLHHHPCDLNKFRRLREKFEGIFTRRLSRLDEGERILKVCDGWIDVIMHGHEHFPVVFREQASGPVIISAGTTSERHAKYGLNSFHSLLFVERSLLVREYRWNGAEFKQHRDNYFQL